MEDEMEMTGALLILSIMVENPSAKDTVSVLIQKAKAA